MTGGLKQLIEHLHDRGNYRIPLKNMAYIIYNMSCTDIPLPIYDPSIYEKFEENYKTVEIKHLNSRFAYGALHAYYKSNCGTRFGIDFWESHLEDNIKAMHV